MKRAVNFLKRTKTVTILLLLCALIAGIALASPAAAQGSWKWGAPSTQYKPWSFGVISDSQWTVDDDGYNPNTVAANIIKQVDQQFINAGVKLVIAVGDTMDKGSQLNIDTGALYAQDLYNAGIGFYPLRGNHEAAEDPNYHNSGLELRYAFPQIGTGVNNNTPSDITTALIPSKDLANNQPAIKAGKTFTIGTKFSQPQDVDNHNNSVSYSFQYNNAMFMLLDQFDVNGNYYNSTIAQQQSWIDQTLSSRPDGMQAFVFLHKNILGGNHKDNMFGGPVNANDPGDGYGLTGLTAGEQTALNIKQSMENAFIASMQANQVEFVISGHDHHDYVSLVTSPDGKSQVHQLITQSDSSKFYTPKTPASGNDISIRQDLGHIGYYIVTVNGPQVTIDYYADISGANPAYGNGVTPFHFVKYGTTCYSLNGKENIVAQGGSYAMQDDTTKAATMGKGFTGTMMTISGTNADTSKTNYGKAISKDVATGWSASQPGLSSDVLTLSGMALKQGDQTDQYVLSMSLKNKNTNAFKNGKYAIATVNNNTWSNAVTKNHGGTPTYIAGAWQASYTLGTYGYDSSTGTFWAVLNYNADFAIKQISDK